MIGWAVAALLAAGASDWPQRLDAVEVRGISWTKESVILRELPWKPGAEVTQAQWELGLTRLWNTGILSRVDGVVEVRDGRRVAVLTLEERFALNPLFSFGAGGGRFWFRVGLNDINFIGRFLEWGARYERFDTYNGGQAWLRDPRLFNRRLDGAVQVDYLFRPRPEYVRRRLGGLVDVQGEVHDTLRLGARVEVFRDEYQPPLVGAAVLPEALLAGTVTLQVRAGRVDTVRLRQKGASVELRQTFGLSADGALRGVVQTQVELLAYALFGERWNLAVRAQAAVSSQAPTEQLFYLGGLDLIRGYADSVVRTQAFALTNAELRATFFDSTWIALVGAVFVDAAIAERSGPVGLLSMGAGVRVLVPKLLRTGLRADVAVAMLGLPNTGFSVGVWQFF